MDSPLRDMSEKTYNVICPSCGVEAEWIPNEQVYNGKRYGKSYMCYYCRQCDYMVGCHNNTRKPLGTMIGKEMRALRKAVHNKIDPLWKSGKYSRGHVYHFISREIGFQFHTAESNEEICRKVLALDWDKLEVFGKDYTNNK